MSLPRRTEDVHAVIDPGENYRRVRRSLPPQVNVVVAAKARSAPEVAAVIEAGATIIGENYVQEAEAHRTELADAADRASWHMIGPLQRNKVRRALAAFDLIQGVGSVRLARAVDQRAAGPVSVCVEVNIGAEAGKHGVRAEELESFLRQVSRLDRLQVVGLMTIEPYAGDPEEARPWFRRMRGLFERAAGLSLPNVRMEVLSMGMSDSYGVAVEEGANMVRIGTAIFGPRSG